MKINMHCHWFFGAWMCQMICSVLYIKDMFCWDGNERQCDQGQIGMRKIIAQYHIR